MSNIIFEIAQYETEIERGYFVPKKPKIIGAPKLPEGTEWKIYNYFTPGGVEKARGITLENFSQCIYKCEVAEKFHLFEMIGKNGSILMCYCIINFK